MPITIVYPPAGNIGPGFQLQLHSTSTSPPGIQWMWVVDVEQRTPANEGWALWSSQKPFENGVDAAIPLDGNVFAGGGFATDLPVKLTIRIQDPNHVDLETLTIPTGWKWDSQANIGREVVVHEGTTALTPEEADQLAGTAETTAVDQLLDFLTLSEPFPGPQPGPLVIPLGTATFGVIVRLATIPAGLLPQTPDNQYWVKTLATVRVFRANDLWFRVPIHTPTKIVPFAHEGLQVWVSSAELNRWILNIRVLVDFLPGVTGQVFLMHTP